LLAETRYAQPALFALEVALYRQWRALGARPQLLLGHSVGELAAAHVAEVLTLADATRLVCARGRLMQELATPGGAMASLELSADELQPLISDMQSKVEAAGFNSPRQTVVSGDRAAVEALVVQLQAAGRKASLLTVSHAFHSPHMESMLEAFRALAAELSYAEPTLAIVSNVSGRRADVASGELVTAEYWVKHVRQAVRFAEGVASAFEAGATSFLECGPQAILSAMVAECAASERDAVIVASLGKGRPERSTMLAAMGELHVHGHALRWEALIEGATRADLPTYAFQRQSFWLRREASAPEQTAPISAARRLKRVDELTIDDLRDVLFRHIPPQPVEADDSLSDKEGMDSLSLLKFLQGAQELIGAAVPAPASTTKLSLGAVLAAIRAAQQPAPLEASAPCDELGEHRRSPWAPYVRQGIALKRTKVRWENGLELELFRFGEGAPLLLLPPFYCEAWVWWPVAQRLATSHTVYLVNLPGYGDAAPFPGMPTPQLLARALTSLRETTAYAQRWTVCGWSFGGFVAQALLELDPPNIGRCVLVNTTACLELGESDGMQTLVRKVRTDLDFHIERSADPSVRGLVYGQQKLELFANYGTTIMAWDQRKARTAASAPTLIMSVLDDAVTPPYMLYEIHDRLPGSEVRAIARGGHYWPLFAPEQFVRAFERWMASKEPSLNIAE
jgi:malonyl CoA-acyl carrier protein transacylase/pimeloyl-ACP methyl ester carboxylesterase